MQGKELKEYHEKQIRGHMDSEKYAFTNPGYMSLMKYLRKLAPETGKILEIGCNTGYECVAMQAEGREVIGIDIGEEFVRKAKSIGVDARVMDMHDLKFKDGTFDCVYINNTLEHSYDPQRVMAEILRVLKKGGTAIVCVPADYKNPDYISTENWDNTLHLWRPDKEEFNRTMVDTGFTTVTVNEVDAETLFGLENRASYNHYMVAVCAK